LSSGSGPTGSRRLGSRTRSLYAAIGLVLPTTRPETPPIAAAPVPSSGSAGGRAEDVELRRVQERTLSLYAAVVLLMLLGIAVLAAYAIRLGPLTNPGAQASFGYAIALMSLMAAVLFHVVDRTYRVWPFGRHFRPTRPGPVTVQAQVRFLQVLTVVLAAAAIAYVIGGLLA